MPHAGGKPWAGPSGIRLAIPRQVLLDDLAEVVNWELVYSREVADRGIRPPIDVSRSFTLRPERLLTVDELAAMDRWRASLTGDTVEDAAALLTWASTPLAAATA